ncbi:MAG: ABC transporter permease [Acidimicrobiia bacterium]|nr:ABC transporter permease [Acidimicrobiia bacterium]MDH4306284.1 ABC transporter permease [Acidimicrobiia bacterium]
MTISQEARPEAPQPKSLVKSFFTNRVFVSALIAMSLFSLIRILTGTAEMSSFQSWGAMLRLAVPILLAGLGGLYAERAGVVNIGLEGMMILGTWFAGYGAFAWGPWRGILFGMVGGLIGGALHALATVTFKIDHIVSGVAINIIGAGMGRFLSTVFYVGRTDAGVTQSPRMTGSVERFTVPILADVFKAMEDTDWFLIGDIGGILHGWTRNISWFTLLAFLLVPASIYLLWRTKFGLRLRSTGENPWAAESLGVRVYTYKWVAVLISGALAGMGGAYLVTEQAGLYREGMTGGRGFIGLAALIFGNWRPAGVATGAAIFGYGLTLQLRGESAAVRALLLFAGIGLLLYALWQFRSRGVNSLLSWIGGVLLIVAYFMVEEIPAEFIAMAPYVLTLIVISQAAGRLRMPAADGIPYRRGEAH